ncbi:undecaprenyl-diphosphate phosphatase [[Clostridium] polysaccharolyticum]|jgi:undecaprenyl-diphosphatase|uniref:Undecaprenyl-diphosphatase n=1 Tax=[Clostridium] polysaccharolyticum TaxID=29364 RepID=A0A1I0ENH3_9FIRM|nr:undecaprenyl-diphosphate phosphatase [[Clostridium] polysaccharolyticum]SET46819.1 undecaprenyl-diphosphatase [[Clostridium] polysaccharolyticum]
MNIIEFFKVFFLGIVEGITEWLPISSTGHMLLVDQFLTIKGSAEFKEMFFVVIQLGAILAVILLFWNKMFPFQFKDKSQPVIRKDIFSIWFKVVAACIPGAAVTLLFDNYVEAHFHTPMVIAAALIFYGLVFIWLEDWNKKRVPKVRKLDDITYATALYIGLFQVLSIVPGTSRSGATIIGALLIGVSRVAAAEFTFFLAVPVMFGYSLLKLAKYGFHYSGDEITTLAVGTITAFLVSVFVIRFLMSYIKKHDFKIFGWYRVVLGVIVILYFVFL